MAACAAFGALCSPEDCPIPKTAFPASVKTVLTSAKSTLITPGLVIKSDMKKGRDVSNVHLLLLHDMRCLLSALFLGK